MAQVEQLTFGPGNDTEPCWSPDGQRIAFQTDRRGDLDICELALAGGSIKEVAAGPGNACYPAYLPDGALAYVFGHHQGTAAQCAGKREMGYGLRLLRNGSETILTSGYWRDYTPSATQDGGMLYYASTQNVESEPVGVWKERVNLRRLRLDGSGHSEPVLEVGADTKGAVQPSLSPDGRLLLWAGLDGFRENWRLCAARLASPANHVFLTPADMAAYAPRWSPGGAYLAFTGFKAGDPGWGVYLLEVVSGAFVRLETGVGNSRSPAWAPDGGSLVFENNRSGAYKLYRVKVTKEMLPSGPPQRDKVEVRRLEARLRREGGKAALEAADGTLLAGTADGAEAFAFQNPKGLDFGLGTFYVRLRMKLNAPGKGITIAAVGNYDEHPLGWQMIVRENGHLGFCPRDGAGQFMEIASRAPLPPGRSVEVIGVRGRDGLARLYIDGVPQGRRGGAELRYGAARRLCLGRQWSGGMKLDGRIEEFECGRGWPGAIEPPATLATLFGGEVQ